MKILITLQGRRNRRYLINLLTKSLVVEVRDLLGNKKYTKAMELVYREGQLEREIFEDDLPTLKADLILSEASANWDIIK